MASWRLKHPSTLAAIYALNGNALDGTGRYPGTLVNTPTWATFMKGPSCIEFDGNDQHVNCGDVTQLNAVSAFSICFWMNQDVIDIDDFLFSKELDATRFIRIRTFADGFLYAYVSDGAGTIRTTAAYALVAPAASWHHITVVYDGTQVAADRLQIFIDAVPMAITILEGLPALSPDLSGIDATIGAATLSFDGKLYDTRIASCAYSRDEIRQIIHESVPV